MNIRTACITAALLVAAPLAHADEVTPIDADGEAASAPVESHDTATIEPAVELGRSVHGAPPNTEPIGITPSGSMLVRYERRLGQMDGEERDLTAIRARFGLHTTPIPIGDDASMVVHFVPQAVGAFTGSGLSSTTGQSVHLYNGYLELALADDHIGLDVGRFTMKYGDALMIGNGGWALRGRAHDGVRLRTRFDNGVAIDGFATMLRETVEPAEPEDRHGAVEPDIWMAAVYAQLGDAIEWLDALDVYEFARVMPTRTYHGEVVTGAVEATTGARVVASTGPATWRAEGGVQYGRRPIADVEVDARAWQVDADVSIALADDRVELTAGGFYATGDDPDTEGVDEGWFEYYPSGHRWLGYMNLVRPRTDIRGAVGRVSAHIGPRVEVFEHVHWFQRAVPVDGDHAFGTEFDTGVEVHAGEHLTLAAEYDVFVPARSDEALIRYAEVGLHAHF